MTLENIIKAINDSNYDDSKVVHGVDAVTPEQKHAREEAWLKRCDVSSDTLGALAGYLWATAPENLVPVIRQLTEQCEKKRLQYVNNELRKDPLFNEAMKRLHEWKAAQPAEPKSPQAPAPEVFGELVGRLALGEDEDNAEFIVSTADADTENEGVHTELFLNLKIPFDDESEGYLVGLTEEKAKELHALLGKGIAKLWP